MRRVVAAVACALLLLSACGGDDDATGDGGAFMLVVVPQFVQGAYPGVPTSVLVRVDATSGGAIALQASATDGDARVEPATVRPGQLAEVTYAGRPVTAEERTVTLTITATRGSVEHEATREIVVMPGVDDRERDARQVLGLFLPALGRDHPELGLDPGKSAALRGRVVAPRLLVVSHYAFFDDQWELGISWHIMIAPNDWAELYLRPRDELAPTRAFRIGSWSTALNGGDFTVDEVAPPMEIVR